MQTNLLWTGIEYYSLENCLVITGNTGNKISSTIAGYYQDTIYSAAYLMETGTSWQTRLLKIKYSINNKEHKITLRKDADEHWLLNNYKINLFKDCVDIAITPFTNTLPVNRLRFFLQEEKEIKVIYINILGNEKKTVKQSYKRIAGNKYLYQNIPKDFEAEIEVDEYGFFTDYPSYLKGQP